MESYKRYPDVCNARPEITKSIKNAGITDMEIYLTGNRMFMIMEVDDTFNFERKVEIDANNPHVQEWEELMWQFQQELQWAEKGEKWIRLEQIFELK